MTIKIHDDVVQQIFESKSTAIAFPTEEAISYLLTNVHIYIFCVDVDKSITYIPYVYTQKKCTKIAQIPTESCALDGWTKQRAQQKKEKITRKMTCKITSNRQRFTFQTTRK